MTQFMLTRRTLVLAAASAPLLGGVARAAVEVNAAAPAFSAPDAAGRARSLSEFAGRTLILEWTNNGCPYVQKHYNSGNMQGLQREATQAGVTWLSVISSAPGQQGYFTGPDAIAYAREVNAAPTAILLDPAGAMGRAYDARTTPHMFVIDGRGRVVYQGAIDDRPSARPATLEGATNYVRAALADLAAGRAVQTAQTTPYGCSVKYAA